MWRCAQEFWIPGTFIAIFAKSGLKYTNLYDIHFMNGSWMEVKIKKGERKKKSTDFESVIKSILEMTFCIP